MRIISFFHLELIKQSVFGILTVCIIIRAFFALMGFSFESQYNKTAGKDTLGTDKRIIRLVDTIEMKNRRIIHLENKLFNEEIYHVPEIMKLRKSKQLINNDGITIDERGRRWNKDTLRKKTRGRIR